MAMKFKQFFLEAFRKSTKVTHLFDVPMFSIYMDNEMEVKTLTPEQTTIMKNVCAEARNQIGKMGFQSMHANVVLKSITQTNHITGEGTAGYAYSKGKYMVCDLKYLQNPNFFVEILVHEWAHLWMYNNSKQFKSAVIDFYKSKLQLFKKDANLNNANFKTEITREMESKLLRNWESRFKHLVSSESSIQRYIQSRIIFTPKNFEQFPTRMHFKVHTKKPFFATKPFSSGQIKTEAGDPIYIEKLYGTWALQIHHEHSRYEKNITEEEIFDYVDQEEFFKNGNEENERQKEWQRGNTMTDVVEDIHRKFERSMKDALLHEIGEKTDEEMDEYCKTVTDFWIKDCIIPIVKKYLKNPKTFNRNVMENPYDVLWVHNPFKEEKNASFIRAIQTLYEFAYKKKRKKDLHYSANLDGPEHNPLRDLVDNMKHVWHSSYGMANDREIWATAIENFFKLPLNDRKAIANLIAKNR
jgi:hypothetical protein